MSLWVLPASAFTSHPAGARRGKGERVFLGLRARPLLGHGDGSCVHSRRARAPESRLGGGWASSAVLRISAGAEGLATRQVGP